MYFRECQRILKIGFQCWQATAAENQKRVWEEEPESCSSDCTTPKEIGDLQQEDPWSRNSWFEQQPLAA